MEKGGDFILQSYNTTGDTIQLKVRVLDFVKQAIKLLVFYKIKYR